jgi:hypothetical protein
VSYDYLSGVISTGYFVATLFFLRFRRQTGERIFAWFAAGFFVLGLQPLGGWILLGPDGDGAPFYLIRLAGFGLIMVGIVSVNRRRPVRTEPSPE